MRHFLPNPGWWRGKRVFLTGHTGFVGGWLALWLTRLGASVSGYSLPPVERGFYRASGIERTLKSSVFGDVLDAASLSDCLRRANPEIVLHLAAQPIVRTGYLEPAKTFATNIMGTVNLLDACRSTSQINTILVFTTDKVYENDQSGLPMIESNRLGGSDPYSASKAATELVAAAYRRSYFAALSGGPTIATVRAGNIIGGGDWASDRLVPDAVRAFEQNKELIVRSPEARRPWQHVIDCVRGLLALAENAERSAREGEPIGWNLGPLPSEAISVGVIADHAARLWGGNARWRHVPERTFTEAHSLVLDASRAGQGLNWRCLWDIARTMEMTIAWYQAARRGSALLETSQRQIEQHESEAQAQL